MSVRVSHVLRSLVSFRSFRWRDFRVTLINSFLCYRHIFLAILSHTLAPPYAMASFSASSSSRRSFAFSRVVRASVFFSASLASTPPRLPRYSISSVAGDGNCLFRAVEVSYALQTKRRRPSLDEELLMARDLRRGVVSELVRRRDDVQWAVEGDFDTYVTSMARDGTWGGEMELLMASHVKLDAAIAVHMIADDVSKADAVVATPRGDVATRVVATYEGDGEGSKVTCTPRVDVAVLYDGVGHYQALARESDSVSKM